MSDEIKLLDVVTLLEDVPSEGLVRGEVGTVVEVFADKPGLSGALLVEFSDRNGESYAFASLRPHQIVTPHKVDASLQLKGLGSEPLLPLVQSLKRRCPIVPASNTWNHTSTIGQMSTLNSSA